MARNLKPKWERGLMDVVRAHGVLRTSRDSGIEQTKISRWLNGHRTIDLLELPEILKAVSCRLELRVIGAAKAQEEA